MARIVPSPIDSGSSPPDPAEQPSLTSRQREPGGRCRPVGVEYSAHLIAQASRVAELLDAGYSNRKIALDLGVSNPRVSQIRSVLPQLAPYLGHAQPLDRLRGHREQLWSLRRQVLGLAAVIRDDLRELDEELEAVTVDRLLGLRR